MVLSRRRRGACDALLWEPQSAAYRCGALTGSLEVARRALPAPAYRMAPWLARTLQRFAGRWIAAGLGCDSHLQADASTIGTHSPRPSDTEP